MSKGRPCEVTGRSGRAAVSRTLLERKVMAHVVTEPCLGCKYTDCVTVCPVDCFHEDEKMLYIDPVDCICCAACVVECPVEAIYHEEVVPPQWQAYIALNAERA